MMAKFSDPFHSCQKGTYLVQPINQFMFRDNSYTFRIILLRTMVKHI